MYSSDYRTSLPRISEVGRIKSIDYQQKQNQIVNEDQAFQKLIEKRGQEATRTQKGEQNRVRKDGHRGENRGKSKRERKGEKKKKKAEGGCLDIKV